MGRFLCEMTYEECEKEIGSDTIIVIPAGGGTKEHGYHLPMGTDMYVTDYIAHEVTLRSNVITLPIVSYAYYPAFIDWKGSVSLEYDTSIKVMTDIILSYARFGVRKFLIIDGGVSTQDPMRILSKEMLNKHGLKVATSNIIGLGKEAEAKVCKQERGGHGDEGETSCMLHIRPDLVHMDKAVEEYTERVKGTFSNNIMKVYLASNMTTPHGINGNSKLATPEKGEYILNAMIDGICEFLRSFEEL